jgi:hypothetical protein
MPTQSFALEGGYINNPILKTDTELMKTGALVNFYMKVPLRKINYIIANRNVTTRIK